jgi:hypothetical protein
MADVTEPDQLYRVPPDQFTAARNALATVVRKEGHKAEADEIKKMRRPSLTAWALNTVARQEPELLEAVLAAGADLRDAMEKAVGGDASGLREAQAGQRQAVDAAVGAGSRVLEQAGHAATETARQRMSGTLHAAVVDDSVAERLRAGTLDEDRDAPGFGLDSGSIPLSPGRSPAAAARSTGASDEAVPAKKAAPAKKTAPAKRPEKAPSEDPLARRRAEREAARAEVEQRRQARVRQAELEADADRLTKRAHRLRGEAEEAERQAKAARAAASQAEREAAAARKRLEKEGG